MEEWRQLRLFQNYEASSEGRIRNRATLRVLTPSRDPKGYFRIMLQNPRKCPLLHRIILGAFFEQPSPLHECNHKDFNRGNNSISNLEWVTRSDNAKHSFHNGRIKTLRPMVRKGEANPRAKLTLNDVNTIRQLSGSQTLTSIANLFSVNASTIHKIVTRKSWNFC